MARNMSSPDLRMSASMKPRVVTAGEPTRRPLATLKELASNGTTLRLAVMFTCSRRSWHCSPLRPVPRRSTSARCTSVPPETRRRPPATSVSASAVTVRQDLLLQAPELLAGGDAQADRLGGDHVHERPTLHAGEHGAVDGLGVLGATHDEAGARARERLVRGARDHIAVRDRVGMHARGDEAGDMSDVGEQHGAHLVGDLAERREVDDPRVGAVAADDELGPMGAGQGAHLIEVDGLGLGVHMVGHHVVGAARVVDVETVREMTAVRELHGHHRVAGLEQREERGEIGGGAGMRLHVDVLGAEKRLAAIDGQLFDLVDDIAAAVVARPRQALGVLVGEHRARRLEHRATREVLAGDELERLLLAGELRAQQLVELRIEVVERIATPLAPDGTHREPPSSAASMRSTRCS